LFGSCIIHILNTGCAKIGRKKNSGAKGLIAHGGVYFYTTGDFLFIFIFLLFKVCGTTGKRKACKNCSCGLAEELAAEGEGVVAQPVQTTTSACGNVS
jgi:hypothetical protein